MTIDFENAPYTVLLSPKAKRSYTSLASSKELLRVDKILLLLETTPEMGRIYDPAYEAAMPSFDLRVAYAQHHGVYYTLDHSKKQVNVVYIEDQRRDPLMRFR